MGTPGPFGTLFNQQYDLEEQIEDHQKKTLEGVIMPRETSTLRMEDSPVISFKPEIANKSLDTSRCEHNILEQILLCAHADVTPHNNITDLPFINIFPSGSNEFILHLSEKHPHLKHLLCQSESHPHFKHLSCERTLHEAVISAKGKIMMFLVPVKQDVNIKEENGIVCLHFASQRGRSELVERLLQPCPKYEDSNDESGYCLHCVPTDNNLDASQPHIFLHDCYPHVSSYLYAECGFSQARVSRIHPELEYCVRMYAHRSCFSDDSDTFTEMLKSAQELGLLSVNAQDTHGNTILHKAAQIGHVDLVKKLLKCGSFISTLNYSSQMPYQLAQELNDAQMLKLLDGHNNSFHKARTMINSEEIAEFEKLLQRQIKICDQYDEVVRTHGIFRGPEPCISAEFNSEVYQTKLKKLLDWVSSGNPLVQPGCINTFILHKASSEGLAIGLYSLLASGAPLWSPICNQSLIQLSLKSSTNPTVAAFIFAKALEDRLVAEMCFDLMDDLDKKLKSAIEDVVKQLRGKTPWQAQYPNECGSDEMTKLLVRACSHGATNAAWWLKNAGASTNSMDRSTGKSALQSALMNQHRDTATDLIRYMGANPFVPDSSGQLPIELFPKKERSNIFLACLAEESSRLIRLCAKVRYRHTIHNEVKRLILLLGVLYIAFQRRATIARNKVEQFYVSSLKCQETMEVMNGLGSDYCDSKAFWSLMYTLLQKIYKPRQFSFENNSSFNQLYLSVTRLSRYILGNQDEKLSFDYVLLDAFKMCIEKRFPLFLHLIMSVGGVNIKHYINEECRTTALHHAAAMGNMSAMSYLISKGAILLAKDKYSRSPLHYASFYGHKITQKYLVSQYSDDRGIHEKCSLGRSAADYSKAYCTYLKTSGVEVTLSPQIYSSENLQIKNHLQKIETLWKAKGIIDATREVTVDYEKGEAACIRNAVEESVKKLLSVVASLDSTFEGDLRLLGSSAEGVRLFVPDEFDFNWILTNKSGFPGGGLRVKLEKNKFPAKGADRTFTVHSDNEECKKWKNGGILREFMTACKKCLVGFEFSDKRLSLVPPCVKYKMVGLGLTIMWTGKDYPLLFIDVDIVPTIKAPWPDDLDRPSLLPKNENVIYLSTSVDGGWRLSNGIVERTIFESLQGMRKVVFLACKMLFSALKVPDWVPADIKNKYRYFADGYQKIPCPNGFVLKSCFFRELEEMKDDSNWLKEKVLERVISILKRMCKKDESNPPKGENRYPCEVYPYIGGSTAEPILATGALEILQFLESNENLLKK